MQTAFGVEDISLDRFGLNSALYLQVSIISQALIFVTRSQSFSFLERPGTLLMIAFALAQLVSSYFSLPPTGGPNPVYWRDGGKQRDFGCRLPPSSLSTQTGALPTSGVSDGVGLE